MHAMKAFPVSAWFLCLCVSAALAGCGGGSSSGSGGGGNTPPPAPTITSVSPTTAPAGSADLTLTVNGTGFLSTTVIQVNGKAEVTTYVSATQVKATVPAAQLTSGATLAVVAVNGSASSGSRGASLEVDNPAPAISSVSPTVELTGTTSLVVNVTGTGFVPATVINVNGSARATTFTSSTQVSLTLTAADVAAAGDLSLTAVNSAPGGGTSTPAKVTVAVPNPVPTISALNPATETVEAASPVITVTGTGFVSSTIISVNGSPRTTTFSSATQVNVTLQAADLSAPGSLALTAVNPAPGGGTSTSASLSVVNPVPAISSLNPATVSIGAATPPTVAVTGTGFVTTTVINVNDGPRNTSFVSATMVNVTLTGADVSALGSLSLTAVNAAPGGGTSAALTLPVNNPTIGTLQLRPSALAVGGTSPATITVTGNTFIPASVLKVNGTTRTSTYVNSTTLAFVASAAEQASLGTFAVTVTNPAPGGGTSPVAVLTIGTPSPTPVISSISPNPLYTGSPDTQITLLGSGFTQDSTVQWNGAYLVVSGFANAYNLIATVPAADLSSVGTATVVVNTPTARPAVSNSVTVNISDPPPPTLTSIRPAAGPINTATTVTLTGTGFSAASTVAIDGENIPSTYVNSTQLTVSLSASSLALPGNLNFTVTTPAPGGGTSPAMPFTAYVPIPNNSMVYNPTNGLFYVSVPSSAGAPYGNSVVSVDPATGALGIPILVGSEPNKLAISSDGKTLWVGLDGASAVREVNLTTGTAGLQFTLGGNGGVYQNPATALALAALPGSASSVVVATEVPFVYEGSIAIFDNGVIRGTASQSNINGIFYALLADGSRSEIYAGGGTYNTFMYNASGLTPLANGPGGFIYATPSSDEMQIAGGRLYTDFGQVFDSESGSLLGTFYITGTTAATGATTVDTTLGKAFVVANSQYGGGSFSTSQINIFRLADFTTVPGSIPVSWASDTSNYNGGPTRLTRWGSNGLAFRTQAGFFVVRSNMVKDLSPVNADLGVSLAASGGTGTGTNTTYTATVSNAGPAAATNVALTATLPANGVLVSITPSAGTCSATAAISCDLGSISRNASVSVSIVVQQLESGSATLTAQVTGSETDPNAANNSASTSVQVSGSAYSLVPTLTAISPAAIESGSGDTTITISGAGFSSGATVQLGSSTLVSSYTDGMTLTATVPAAELANLGWAPITIRNPAPGGGVSNALPLSIYSVLTLGVNHILFDPYSREIMASVGSGSSSITGNSIVAIDPETVTVGSPVSIGSQPENMALTSDGQILYTILIGSQSVARFNMLTQSADYTYPIPSIPAASGIQGVRGVATQPGTEDTVNLDLGSWAGNAISDFDPVHKTAAIRGQASGPYSGSCVSFLDATNLLAFDTDTSGATLDHYTVTAAGFTYYNYQQYSESTLNGFGCFKIDGGLAFANAGGVANPATVPATQIGVYKVSGGGIFSTFDGMVPDTSLGSTFFLVDTNAGNLGGAVDGVTSFDQKTFLRTATVSLNMGAIEGTSSYGGVDLIRWGQDGLAVLTSGNHIYLMRGGFVVPQLMQTHTAATLASSSTTTIAHGSGNVLLTLTGSNFVPGAAVTWNGAYRTTTIVDATHVKVAIPASDLAATGSANLVATNPGAAASNSLTITIN
jgi:trimeric autotransporter adhesin